MLKRLLLLSAKGLLFFVLVWLAVIAYWQYARRVVSSADLLVYLVLLPLGLLLAFGLAKGMLQLVRWARSRFLTQAVGASPDSDVAGEASSPGRNPHDSTVFVLAGAISSGMGGAQEWIEKSREYAIHHKLDQDLTDALGFGVRSVRMTDLDGDEVPEGSRAALMRMDQMLDQVRNELSDVLREAATYSERARHANYPAEKRADLHPEWLGQPASMVKEVSEPVNLDKVATALTVCVLLPGFVTAEESKQLVGSCHVWALELGWKPEAVHMHTVVMQHSFDGLKKISEIVQQHTRNHRQILTVLSAVSWLDETVLSEKLQHDRDWAERLMKSATIIGEAAAGLVLSKNLLVNPETGETHEAVARLSSFSIGERDKSVDVKGSIEAGLLAQMLQAQKEAVGIELDQFKNLVVSGDHWQGRPVELGRWLTDCLPHMSLVDDSIQVGLHLGECEPVSDLLGLVLTAEHSRQSAVPVLFCSNHSSHWRAMSVALPLADAA